MEHDVDAAANLLREKLPVVRRMQRHAQMLFTSQSLREAVTALPARQTVPAARSPSSGLEMSEILSSPAPANSNDLMPVARGPNTSGGQVRKRRKLRIIDGRGDIISSVQPGAFSDTASFQVARPSERLVDVAGIDAIVKSIIELIEWPLRHSMLYEHLGIEPPQGILLHGPPGCGKTLLAHAIAGELDVPLLKISAPEIVSGMSGESEKKVRDLFVEASRIAPCIVFIDEVDTIASRREDASKDMGKRIVAQLLTCLDELRNRRRGSHRNYNSSKDAIADDDLQISDLISAPDLSANGDIDSSVSAGTGFAADSQIEMETNGSPDSKLRAPVVVIAATNRPEVIEPALRRAGRFDREIELGAPDDVARCAILKTICRNLRLSKGCDFEEISRKTAGFVGADLELLVKEAGVLSIRRFLTGASCGDDVCNSAESKSIVQDSTVALDVAISGPYELQREKEDAHIQSEHVREMECGSSLIPSAAEKPHHAAGQTRMPRRRGPYSKEELMRFAIFMDDFVEALDKIQPSALREGFATRPNVSWDDVGALEEVREDLSMAIIEPIRVPERFSKLGLSTPAGVLLYGPPGCGKTLLARAVAAESGANFISVKGPELLSKYVGDSELAVRKLFNRARASAPCIVFFDELDALAPRRGGGSSGGGSDSGASERVVNMLLTEMDGFDVRKQVFLIAATNRPDIIDPAMLRPGRLDKLLYVPLPSEAGRASILRKLIRRISVAADVDVPAIAADKRCDCFSGADMYALVRAAGENALRESLARSNHGETADVSEICAHDFDVAMEKVLPSVSPQDATLYRSMKTSLRKSRAHLKTI